MQKLSQIRLKSTPARFLQENYVYAKGDGFSADLPFSLKEKLIQVKLKSTFKLCNGQPTIKYFIKIILFIYIFVRRWFTFRTSQFYGGFIPPMFFSGFYQNPITSTCIGLSKLFHNPIVSCFDKIISYLTCTILHNN